MSLSVYFFLQQKPLNEYQKNRTDELYQQTLQKYDMVVRLGQNQLRRNGWIQLTVKLPPSSSSLQESICSTSAEFETCF